jgi:integrase
MAKVRSSPDTTVRAVTCHGQLVGSVASFVFDGETDVTYWIDRASWGHGIASRALELPMDLVPIRPLHARAASDNIGSLRVLQKAGFKGIDASQWTPRELRHSFASQLSDNKVPLVRIAHLVGHKSTIVTELVYRQQIRPMLQDGAAIMNELFGSADGS